MPFSLKTDNREASESYTNALLAMKRYYEKRRVSDIEEASRCIDIALRKDDDYGRAIFLKGIVLDLIGRAADAPPYFDRILRECESEDLKWEATFNLGVVNYHQYSHQFLTLAKGYFEKVINESQKPLQVLRAKGHLAQTHAMFMRPSSEELKDKAKLNSAAVRLRIQKDFDVCQALVSTLLSARVTDNQIAATCANADGMSNMYLTDHVARSIAERERHLKKARESLLTAERLLADDWANTSDLGSVELRLAILASETNPADQVESNEHFAKAKQYLTRVVDILRPGYGFALYELGILHRLWKKWDEAAEYLQRACQIPAQYRDISDVGINEQLRRVNDEDSSFP